jgi:hypothetical protein
MLSLLVAPVAVALGCHGLGVAPAIRAERPPDIHLILGELALIVAADVPLVAIMRLDQLALVVCHSLLFSLIVSVTP